eukprot:CAMPEP_0202381596 /NCGR_PEP_ID=MMETSP1127-20130417/37063_1 /ASSEMBLY_ACC=CAM_ASM_000462 /TAXON_ID=3047 /ORGANISM="Dunaliella tertiolecta, Strain CCMP1320" /LENGTH=64 /DNA_ID=CAMNT_0048980609 /DNA_START=343 /DNA_END=537 /DNA_ORIENTATION=+
MLCSKRLSDVFLQVLDSASNLLSALEHHVQTHEANEENGIEEKELKENMLCTLASESLKEVSVD